MIELRGHHLLCTSLFQGSGYSEEFVKRCLSYNWDKLEETQ